MELCSWGGITLETQARRTNSLLTKLELMGEAGKSITFPRCQVCQASLKWRATESLWSRPPISPPFLRSERASRSRKRERPAVRCFGRACEERGALGEGRAGCMCVSLSSLHLSQERAGPSTLPTTLRIRAATVLIRSPLYRLSVICSLF